MRAIQLLTIAALMILASACSTRVATKKAAGNAPAAEDRYEVLLRHALRRSRDLEKQVADQENQCLKEENRILRGERKSPLAAANDLAASLDGSNDRIIQGLLDSEDYMQEHNRRHPEEPWADVQDLIREMCGECRKERVQRDLEMAEEAKKAAQISAAARLSRPLPSSAKEGEASER